MSRNRLHIKKLTEFESFCEQKGWQKVNSKSFYEALRMKKDNKTLLVHQRHDSSTGTELIHLTLHGESEIMFSKYVRDRKLNLAAEIGRAMP